MPTPWGFLMEKIANQRTITSGQCHSMANSLTLILKMCEKGKVTVMGIPSLYDFSV